MPMSTEEWLERNLAAAPPLTPQQVAVLRPIWQPAIPPNGSAVPRPPSEGRAHDHASTSTPARSAS